MRNLGLFLLCLVSYISVTAQMQKNGQTLYGNEWIDYNRSYLKAEVEEDGMYIVTYNNLIANGFTPQQLNGTSFKMFHNGEEVPLFITNNGNWSDSDFLVFYGEKNKGEIDRFQFEDPETQQLNPEFSMYSSTSSYYLTVNPSTTNLRYTTQPNNVNGTNLSKRTFFEERLLQVFSDALWDPAAPTDRDLQFSNFIAMDGFASPMRTDHTVSFEIKDYVSTGTQPKLSTRIGSNNATHFVQLEFNNNPIINDNYQGSIVKQYDIDVNKANIRNNATNNIRLRGLSTADNLNIAYMELRYPKAYDAENESTYVFYSGQDNFNEYVEIPNYRGTTRNFVFDVENHNVMVPVLNGTTARVIVPGAAIQNSKIILTNAGEFKSPVTVSQKTFTSFDDLNPEYLILTSEVLNQTENGRNLITEYSDFRASDIGGGYKTGVVNVEDIYEQFGYGINQHSHAIKNFSSYIKPKWPEFEMVFIIGKALSFAHSYNDNTIAKNLVPTYGRPGGDNLLFEDGNRSYPYVGIGRLAARSQDDIRIYLDKARTNAALSDVASLTIEQRLWLKNILHLSGGDRTIQEQLFDTLTMMENIIENNKYAGSVTTFRKNSSDPVTTALSQQILNEIDAGLSLLTFFGHSSAGTWDFSVEDPSKYMNFGKHPVVLSMGCHSGDIHENLLSLSEDFIFTEDLGAIAFIASSGNAYPEPLSEAARGFYQAIGDNFYGQPIGLASKDIMERIYDRAKSQYDNITTTVSFNDAFASTVTLLQQNTIHGDPAIKFFSADAPDYIVDFASIETNDIIGTTEETIEIRFDLLNLGAGSAVDSINNYIVHEYNSQVDTIFFTTVAPNNRTPISVVLPNPKNEALGKNSINIVLDYDNRVQEFPDPQGEENNDIKNTWMVPDGYCFYIFDTGAKPIYPKEFSIIGQQGITLKASAPNALADIASYQIEVDTTAEFNSPFLRSVEVISRPSLIEWEPNITYREEVVYYWRIKPNNNADAIWSNSSFVYLDQVPGGWNQSHFYQWTADETKTAFIDSTTRDFTYVSSVNDIKITNGTFPNVRPQITHQDNLNTFIEFGTEIISGIYMATFDAATGLPRYNDYRVNGEFGSHIDAQWVGDEFFSYPYRTVTKDQRANVINFIENEVPDGDYIAFFTIQRTDFNGANYYPERWAADSAGGGLDIFTVLEKHGATQVRSLEAGPVPYIFVFKKNDSSWTPIEIKANNAGEEISTEFKIDARWFEGEIKSTTIGPAQSWDKLIWNIDEIDLLEDTYQLDLIGINASGEEVLLRENIDEFDYDLSNISAAQYPNLKLNLYTMDEASRTSPQMEHWRVLYTELPEALLDLDAKYTFQSDTISGSENFVFSTKATNISSTDMDSLLVEYVITDSNNTIHRTEKTLPPLKAFESIDIDFETPTGAYLGKNEFKIEINPGPQQQEQFYFNNVGLRDFVVLGDSGNPLLDVTFDGVRILDRDIVSPNPTITVMLKDDNNMNPITDISNFNLSLRRLPSLQSETISLDSEDIMFFPADSSNNYCARIEYTPEFESGEYVFYAQGEDASGNLSGDQAYSVQFEVILESMVSNVLNYPNPFSTSTEFIFTLTGSEVPDEFTIQIYSMSGKVVKEITKEELGPLKIGLNRTSYKWTGTDDFGNKLGNGVYFYRVITSEVEGEKMDHYNNADIDGYFKKGFGKLVIMR